MGNARALLLDIGEVVMRADNELVTMFAERTGRSLRRGALDPDNDPPWREFLAGSITYRDYWNGVALDAGFADMSALWLEVVRLLDVEIFDPLALALIEEARAAGVLIGVLSNDLLNFSPPGWVMSLPLFMNVDALVDSQHVGVRKPAPDGYLLAAEKLGLSPSEIVFLDDTPECVEGAIAVGMRAILVHPHHHAAAFDSVRSVLGLRPESWAERHVRIAEETYQSNDLDAIMRLLHPQITVWWNGRLVASGHEQARQFHLQRLGFGVEGSRREYHLNKTLRSASGDTICVEWDSSYLSAEGVRTRSRAGEFWRMRDELLIEWHAYNHRWEAS